MFPRRLIEKHWGFTLFKIAFPIYTTCQLLMSFGAVKPGHWLFRVCMISLIVGSGAAVVGLTAWFRASKQEENRSL